MMQVDKMLVNKNFIFAIKFVFEQNVIYKIDKAVDDIMLVVQI